MIDLREYAEYADSEFIGTDGSLEVCINEGYLMMEFSPEDDFTPDTYYRLLRTLPEYITKGIDPFHLDMKWTWNQLIEIYDRDRAAIDSFADDIPDTVKEPGFYAMLNLADTLDAYYGLNNQ